MLVDVEGSKRKQMEELENVEVVKVNGSTVDVCECRWNNMEVSGSVQK